MKKKTTPTKKKVSKVTKKKISTRKSSHIAVEEFKPQSPFELQSCFQHSFIAQRLFTLIFIFSVLGGILLTYTHCGVDSNKSILQKNPINSVHSMATCSENSMQKLFNYEICINQKMVLLVGLLDEGKIRTIAKQCADENINNSRGASFPCKKPADLTIDQQDEESEEYFKKLPQVIEREELIKFTLKEFTASYSGENTTCSEQNIISILNFAQCVQTEYLPSASDPEQALSEAIDTCLEQNNPTNFGLPCLKATYPDLGELTTEQENFIQGLPSEIVDVNDILDSMLSSGMIQP